MIGNWVLRNFFGYKNNKQKRLSIETNKKTFSLGENISGTLTIKPKNDFIIHGDFANISLKRRTQGKEDWLRDYFQNHHMVFPKKIWKTPLVFKKNNIVTLPFDISLSCFKEISLKSTLKNIKKNTKRDKEKAISYQNSLQTLTRHLQGVINTSVCITNIVLSLPFIDEASLWLEKEINAFDTFKKTPNPMRLQ